MFKKIAIIGIIVIVIGAVLFFAIDGSAKKEDGYKTVEVTKGSIIDKALAVGKIEPKQEISVKSKIPGIVRKIYVEMGDRVAVGDPLFDIGPDPTPIELTEAQRDVEIRKVTYDNDKRELDRLKSLLEKNLVSPQEYDNQEARCEESRLRLQLSKEKLSLIESGKSSATGASVDNIIKSPISGTVLSRLVEEGDPVVPLTTFQAGTELMTLAKMDDLIFKGNVDEIDVGKLSEGMPAEIEIGALSSQDKVSGTVTKISPKAHKEEGSTLFEVEIRIDELGAKFLRAGYSANADVIITRKEDIILIPERLIRTKDSAQFVEVQDSLLVITEREIKTGLSDGINIEVVDGLDEGEILVERPPKDIEVWD
ncbi:MAG: efflux RND transporter periplasmic adaptor subunit [Candidatus Zixiibacteriota bacterium]|nr:MAG: efflux RND transporter periplasmic adaptor subunit [candidate division Zixibacteria bacterium]